MKKLPDGHKLLPPGVQVFVGRRKYRYSCPTDLHPDNFKKATVTKSTVSDEKKDKGK